MSGIKYQSGGSGVTILSLRGIVPGGAFPSLSSNPFVVIPANTLLANKIFVPISFTIRMAFATTGLAFPAGLTYDSSSTFPFFEFTPRINGATWITCGPSYSLLTFAQTEFNENNLPLSNVNIVIKSVGNSPGADFEDAPYELLYCLINTL